MDNLDLQKDLENFAQHRVIQQMQSFMESLIARGFTVQDVEPRGNCLFEAVALQLMQANVRNIDGGFYSHSELRAEAVRYIREHQGDYDENQWFGIFIDHVGIDTVEAYLNHVGQVGVFADHFAIQALADALGVNINIMHLDGNTAEIVSRNSNIVLDINVLYLNVGEHYMSVTHSQGQGSFIPYAPVLDTAGIFSHILESKADNHDDSSSFPKDNVILPEGFEVHDYLCDKLSDNHDDLFKFPKDDVILPEEFEVHGNLWGELPDSFQMRISRFLDGEAQSATETIEDQIVIPNIFSANLGQRDPSLDYLESTLLTDPSVIGGGFSGNNSSSSANNENESSYLGVSFNLTDMGYIPGGLTLEEFMKSI